MIIIDHSIFNNNLKLQLKILKSPNKKSDLGHN